LTARAGITTLRNLWDTVLRRIEYGTDTVAIIAIFACMVVVTIDVFGRYVLNSPQGWVMEVLVLYLLPAVFFMGLPGSYAKGAHVAVDIVCNYVSPRVRLNLSLVARVSAIVVFVAIAYYGVERVIDAVRLREIQPGTLNWPIWPSVLLVPIGSALTLVRAVERFVIEVEALRGGDAAIRAQIRATPHEEDFVQ
jgi:TRAP-type C4-dicarboxylate transport system permease small subunit